MDHRHGHTLALFSLAYIIHLLKTDTAADPLSADLWYWVLHKGKRNRHGAAGGAICNWVSPETSSFCVCTGLFCWLKPLFVCRFQSINCDMQFVKVKESLNWWSIGDRPNFPFQYSLSWPHPDEDWRPCISFKAVKWRCKLLQSLTYCSLLFFCHRLEAFNFFKLVFISIMHFLLFNSSMQLPGVGNWSFGTGS
jgi:hypothetical protein